MNQSASFLIAFVQETSNEKTLFGHANMLCISVGCDYCDCNYIIKLKVNPNDRKPKEEQKMMNDVKASLRARFTDCLRQCKPSFC